MLNLKYQILKLNRYTRQLFLIPDSTLFEYGIYQVLELNFDIQDNFFISSSISSLHFILRNQVLKVKCDARQLFSVVNFISSWNIKF